LLEAKASAEAWAAEAIDADMQLSYDMQLASLTKEGEAATAAAAAAAAASAAEAAADHAEQTAAADHAEQTAAAVTLQSAQRAKVGRCNLKPAYSL
jgi:hypothetical protein